MNELIFLIHILLVTISVLGALRLGKEALVSIVALQAIIANLFVLKQIKLFGFDVTCTDVFSIGCILGINLLNEYYGAKAARLAIWVSFGCMLFFGLMSQMHLMYHPSMADGAHTYFLKLLAPIPRVLGASFVSYLVSSQFDVWFYSLLKKRLSNYLVFRTGVSLAATQLLDTVLFSFLGLYGVLNSMADIIVLSYVIKLMVIMVAAPFNSLSKRVSRVEVVSD